MRLYLSKYNLLKRILNANLHCESQHRALHEALLDLVPDAAAAVLFRDAVRGRLLRAH